MPQINHRYRFKCCGNHFCSTECFNRHGSCESTQSSESRANFPPKRTVRADNYDLQLDESEQLSDGVLEQLSTTPDVILKLSDPMLQRILTKLDVSRDRRHTFAKLYESSSLFRGFVDSVSQVVGFKLD